MLKVLGEFFLFIHPLWNIIVGVAVLTVPILLIIFFRPKWLAILLGAVNLVAWVYIDAVLGCLRPDELCLPEDFEGWLFLLGFIYGIIYGLLVLAVVSLIRMLIRRRSRPRGKKKQ
jgi:uncharacterized membrane protein YphA (DoxX/SURF4 family)